MVFVGTEEKPQPRKSLKVPKTGESLVRKEEAHVFHKVPQPTRSSAVGTEATETGRNKAFAQNEAGQPGSFAPSAGTCRGTCPSNSSIPLAGMVFTVKEF